MRWRESLALPVAAALLVALALGIGYPNADRGRHRPPPPTATPDLAFPGTTLLRGRLLRFNQSVMTVRTASATYAVILSRSTSVLAACGHLPTLRPGEDLEVRIPVAGNGVLLARMIRPAGPCH